MDSAQHFHQHGALLFTRDLLHDRFQPVDILGVDAAILFSDILTPVEPMGMKLDFVPGPVFESPIRTMADVEKLRIPDPEQDVPYVLEAIRILRRELERKVPLIGFARWPPSSASGCRMN